ncbi:TAP-like protein [Microlunatus soli]|uniref:TAP-like protein n=1 Tax=Microlunatus soli TaxID=630515 RepID=A0A1H1X047_9ACTN|nr:TAP-like protein [Microlunatus soli]
MLAALLCLVPGVGNLPTARAEPAPSDKTSAKEAKRVDSVPTPRLNWYPCNDYDGAQCATVKLPLDYDKPNGAKVELALLKMPATDPDHKVGSIFVNPGGPGGSAVDFAASAPYLFNRSITGKFDVIGIDPRGIGSSDQVTCFPDARRQQRVLNKLDMAFPVKNKQVTRYSSGSEELGKACSDYGKKLAGAMSTAEDARDMDVIRRAVGDRQLTYIGFSYGTYLGQVYATMFPDRVRSMVIDGVLDPVAWAGTAATRDTPQTLRVPSGEGSYRALKEMLRRCDAVGSKKCSFASTVDDQTTLQKFDALAALMRKKPIVIDDVEGNPYSVDYATMISTVLDDLYDPAGSEPLTDNLSLLWKFSGLEKNAVAIPAADQAAARKRFGRAAKPYGFPYDNSLEAFTGVLCTDSMNPSKVSAWPPAIKQADPAAKYFGELWAWSSAPCAGSTWTVTDEDAYRGPFDKKTAGPVLVIGDYWDPATNYKSAVAAAGLLGNSRLLLSDSWGHTAYGTSACVNQAVTTTLRSVKLPAKGTRCVGDVQPFTDPQTPEMAQRRTQRVTGIDPAAVDSALRDHRMPGRF